MEQRDVPMIPKHQAESVLMHMSWAIKCIMTVAIAFCITIAVCVYIFVNGYTSRTKDWLNTYNNLQRTYAVTEGADEEEATGSIQQSSVP